MKAEGPSQGHKVVVEREKIITKFPSVFPSVYIVSRASIILVLGFANED